MEAGYSGQIYIIFQRKYNFYGIFSKNVNDIMSHRADLIMDYVYQINIPEVNINLEPFSYFIF